MKVDSMLRMKAILPGLQDVQRALTVLSEMAARSPNDNFKALSRLVKVQIHRPGYF